MKQLIFYFAACPIFLLLNCTQKNTKVNKPYIISEVEKKHKIGREEPQDPMKPPPPPRSFAYGSNIFIIDKDTNVFYWQRVHDSWCSTGSDHDTIPRLMELQKEDFIPIPKNSVGEFIALNLKKNQSNVTDIASQLDTLNFKTYYQLLDAVEKSFFPGDQDFLIIRHTTQEEDTVLYYKKKLRSYNSKHIQWNLSKIDTTVYKFVAKANHNGKVK